MSIHLQETPIEPWSALAAHESQNSQLSGQFGATNIFIGSMRDMNLGDQVSAMQLEHYPDMTQRFLQKIESAAVDKFQLLDSLLIHRFGSIKPNDTIVVIACWAAHRNEAFQACRFMIEELKQQAPFWKKETLPDSGKSRWISSNS